MSAAHSVIGFVPDAVAKQLHSAGTFGHDTIEVPLDTGKQAATLRVRHGDVAEVRLGPSRDGHTGVQLVLKPGAKYEFAQTSDAEGEFTALRDPAYLYQAQFQRFVIYVSPIFRPVAGKAGAFEVHKF